MSAGIHADALSAQWKVIKFVADAGGAVTWKLQNQRLDANQNPTRFLSRQEVPDHPLTGGDDITLITFNDIERIGSSEKYRCGLLVDCLRDIEYSLV